MAVRRLRAALVVALLLPFAGYGRAAEGARRAPKVDVHFAGTAREVSVYTVSGAAPGPTLVIFGGIHGDESGGYVTVDRYVDASLRKGTLIVVPRLNLSAILRGTRFGAAGDMNRKFHLPEDAGDPDLPAVNLARSLIGRADCVLNVHQGDGFYSPVWVDRQRNPMKWGQCNVIDAPIFDLPNGEHIRLEEFARAVVRRSNARIRDSRYHFHVNNTDTASEKSLHKEQRKSLTYYALTRAHTMSLGVESTRNCPLAGAVAFLTTGINAVIAELGIEADVLPPEDRAAVERELAGREAFDGFTVRIDGETRNVQPGRTIFARPGARLELGAVSAPTGRGWFLSLGSALPPGPGAAQLSGPTSVSVRKDGRIVAVSRVAVCPSAIESVEVELDGRTAVFRNQETISLSKDGRLRFVRALPDRKDAGLRVDVKGFVGNRRRNDGQDLGYAFGPSSLIARHAVDGARTLYRVEIWYGATLAGELFLRVPAA